ncbi:hypothetical protein ACTXT7_001186 [Hymenolepis weldensis]
MYVYPVRNKISISSDYLEIRRFLVTNAYGKATITQAQGSERITVAQTSDAVSLVNIALVSHLVLSKEDPLTSLMDKEPDPERNEMTDHLLTEWTRFPSDDRPTNIRRSHSQGADFVENVTIIETAPYEDFNKTEPQQQEGINLDEAELMATLAPISPSSPPPPLSNAYVDAARPYKSMRCEAIFQKMIFKECLFTDRNIKLVGLDWIGFRNLKESDNLELNREICDHEAT